MPSMVTETVRWWLVLGRRLIALLIAVALGAVGAVPAQASPPRDWAAVIALRQGRRIQVTLQGDEGRIIGTLQHADENGMLLQVAGTDRLLDRARIRRVSYSRSAVRSFAPIIGGAAGVATIGTALHRGGDFVWSFCALVGGAIGATVGFLLLGERVIYEAPRH